MEAPSIGLENCGNTCFLNAVLQCLLHTPMLRHLLELACPFPREAWLGELLNLFRSVDNAKHSRGTVSAARLADMFSVASTNSEFGRGQQADAHEAFMLLLSKLLEGCIAMCFGDDHPLSFAEKEQLERSSLIGHVFGMDLGQKVRCNSCSYESATSRVEYCLCISCTLGMSEADLRTLSQEAEAPKRKSRFLSSRSGSRASNAVLAPETSLASLLKEFTRGETIPEFRCEKCSKTGCTRTACVARPPNVLLIHVYRRQGSGLFGKIDRRVRFPQELVLAPYVGKSSANGSSGGPEGQNGDADNTPAYSLFAVIVHRELSSISGHYVAYVRDGSSQWHMLDDTHVEAVDWAIVQEQYAYLLLYQADRTLPPEAPLDSGPTPAEVDDRKKQAVELRRRGDELAKKKDFESALSFYTQACEVRPEDAVLHLCSASAYRQLKRWEMAEKEAVLAAELDQANGRACWAQAVALRAQGKLRKALEACRAGLTRQPDSNQLLQLLCSLEQALKIVELKKKGADLLERGQLAEALDVYSEGMELQPREVAPLLRRAGVYRQLGDNVAAKLDYESALELDAKNFEVHAGRCAVASLLGAHDAALESASAALAVRPDDEELQRIRDAADQALRLADVRGRAQGLVEKAEHEEALKVIDGALADWPKDVVLIIGRSTCNRQLGHWEAAEQDALLVLEVAPDSTEAYRARALALQAGGQLSAAVDCCQAGRRACPEADAELEKLEEELVQDIKLAEAAAIAALEVSRLSSLGDGDNSPKRIAQSNGSSSPKRSARTVIVSL